MSNENQQKVNWKTLKFGAIWLKGNKYSGTVTINGEQKRIIGFLKKPDDNQNAPDIGLFFAPDDNSPAANTSPAAAQQQRPQQQPQGANQQRPSQASNTNKPNRSLL